MVSGWWVPATGFVKQTPPLVFDRSQGNIIGMINFGYRSFLGVSDYVPSVM